MKSRTALILVLAVLLVAGSVVGYLWHRRNQGEYLRGRAQLKMRTGRRDEAQLLIKKYIGKYPDLWQGYYTQGNIFARFGEYDSARKSFDISLSKAPKDKHQIIQVSLARTYSMPAVQTLNSTRYKMEIAAMDQGISLLERSNEILEGALDPATADRAKDQELLSLLAQNYKRIGAYHAMRAARYQMKLVVSKSAEDLLRIATNRAANKASQAASVTANTKALDLFMRLLAIAPDSSKQAIAAVELAVLQRSETKLNALAKQIEAIPGLPEAKSQLWMYQLSRMSSRLSRKERDVFFKQVESKLQTLHKTYPDSTQVLVALSQLAIQDHRHDRAQEILTAAIGAAEARHATPDREIMRTYASLLRAQGNYKQAYNVLSDLRDRYPRWADVQCSYALVAEKCGKEGIARSAMRLTTELMPYHARARQYMAEMLSRQGFHDRALDEAKLMYEGHPSSPDAVTLVVTMAIRAEKIAAAETVLTQAMALHADRPNLMLAVSRCYRQIGQEGMARKAAGMVRTNTVAGDYAEEILAIRALLGEKRFLQADSKIQALLQTYPDDEQLQLLQATLLAQRGRTFLAIPIYQDLVTHGSDPQKYRQLLAAAAFDIGQFSRARSVAEQVIQDDPTNIPMAMLLQQISVIEGKASGPQPVPIKPVQMVVRLLQAGKTTEALEFCRRSAPDAKDPTVWALFAEAQKAVGDLQGASLSYAKAITLRPQRLSYYQEFLRVRMLYQPLKSAVLEFVRVPNADTALVHIAHAHALTQRGDLTGALREYRFVQANKRARADAKLLARYYNADLLLRANQPQAALALLTDVKDAGALAQRMELLRVAVLLRLEKLPEAYKALDAFAVRMLQERDAHQVVQIVGLWLKINQFEKALTLARQLGEIVPRAVEPLILQGEALARMGKPLEAEAALVAARQLQPSNQAVHIALAQSQARRQKWDTALATLKAFEATGETGSLLGQLERANLYSRWGLAREATDVIETLLTTKQSLPPQAYYFCARAYLALGDPARARKAVEAISSVSPYYVQGWLLLAAANQDRNARIAIYREILKHRPSDVTAVGGEMMALISLKQFAQASERFDAFVHTYRSEGRWPMNLGSLALAAAMENRFHNATPKAIALAETMSKGYPQTHWPMRLLLLQYVAGNDAWIASRLAVPKDVYEVVLRMLSELRAGKGKVPSTLRLGWEELAEKLPKEFGPYLVEPMRALLNPAGASIPQGDARAMLESILAARSKMPGMVEILRERWLASPTSPQLAEMLWKLSPTTETLAAIIKSYPDRTSGFYRRLAAESALRRAHITGAPRDYAKAITLFEALSKEAGGKAVSLELICARTYEQAGQLAKAETRYRAIYARTKAAAVGNNLAFLLVTKPNPSFAELREAELLSKASFAASPGDPAVQDTRGWVLLSQGKTFPALALLRHAALGLSQSVQMQCHLGAASEATGKRDWARRHYQAAIDLGRELQTKVDKARKEGTLLGWDVDPADLAAIQTAHAKLKALDK
ncbi:MAG: hypothetical protein HN370_07650 [Phycisphaerales bacterium]|nr:hypothetical protein [Phycisphaerales bacterium]